MTIKLTLAYDGTDYHGWQVQPALPSIQGELAAALLHVTGEQILPQASGRTDAGVHALGQVVSFVMRSPIPLPNLHRALNRALPAAIRVISVEDVPDGFHARYDAIGKIYEYRIFNRFQEPGTRNESVCPPTLARYVWNCPWQLDLATLNEAAALIVGEHDFTSFAAVDPEKHTDASPTRTSNAPPGNIRRIHHSAWTQHGELFTYRVKGSGFLHHMVRNLVGSFVDAACQRTDIRDFPAILAARDRSAAGATAPASGLFLISVDYPDSPPSS